MPRRARTDTNSIFGLATIVGTGIYWPSVEGDGLTVYYHRNMSLFRHTRMSTAEMFSGETAIAAGTDANISDDGRELLYFTDMTLARAACN